jgi:hypothetical protein
MNGGSVNTPPKQPKPKSAITTLTADATNKRSPNGMKANLPPHKWSLPIESGALDYTETAYVGSQLGTVEGNHPVINNGTRRAILWYFNGPDVLLNETTNTETPKKPVTPKMTSISELVKLPYNQAVDAALASVSYGTGTTGYPGVPQSINNQIFGKTATSSQKNKLANSLKQAVATTTKKKKVTDAKAASSTSTPKNAVNYTIDNDWAFQFLWNPTDISVSLQRNVNVTPNVSDQFATVAGFFPSQESVTFTITLDRTWDMACIRNMSTEEAVKYYITDGNPLQLDLGDMNRKVEALKKLGTGADIEYLLKVINGEGKGNQGVWTNGLGKQTADIGYLLPNLLAVSFGPMPDSLSYVGWISSLQISHAAFTEDMIPIRTSVQVSLDCLSASRMDSVQY